MEKVWLHIFCNILYIQPILHQKLVSYEKEVLSWWREYFEDLLNRVTANHVGLYHFGEEEVAMATGAKVKIGKGYWWRWNPTLNDESIECRRNSLVSKGVSVGVETWKDTEGLAEGWDNSDILERQLERMHKLSKNITTQLARKTAKCLERKCREMVES